MSRADFFVLSATSGKVALREWSPKALLLRQHELTALQLNEFRVRSNVIEANEIMAERIVEKEFIIHSAPLIDPSQYKTPNGYEMCFKTK